MSKELTTKEKWYPVDTIIKRIDDNRAKGRKPYEYGIDEYVDIMFNK